MSELANFISNFGHSGHVLRPNPHKASAALNISSSSTPLGSPAEADSAEKLVWVVFVKLPSLPAIHLLSSLPHVLGGVIAS